MNVNENDDAKDRNDGDVNSDDEEDGDYAK